MSVFFTRLKVGHPEPLRAPEDTEESWKVFTVCRDQNKASCSTRKDVSELERPDKEKARTAYVSLLNKAQAGQPFSAFYDEKQCHEAHTYNVNGAPFTIYRIRAGDIRIYFCYLPDKKIILLKTRTKRKNDLSKGEKNELEKIANDVLQYLDSSKFMLRVI